MVNGNIIGCSNFKPRYNKHLNNRLEISAGFNTDVAVKLIDNETENCIRYVYIKKDTKYIIRNIPEGKYYLKIAYGDDWGVKDGDSKCDGKFTTNALYKKSDEILDFNLISDENGTKIPSYSLQLSVLFSAGDSDNFSTNKIPEDEFYK
jgi:hypothetical protein